MTIEFKRSFMEMTYDKPNYTYAVFMPFYLVDCLNIPAVSCDADLTENYMYISMKFGTGVHEFCWEVGVFNRSSFQSVSYIHSRSRRVCFINSQIPSSFVKQHNNTDVLCLCTTKQQCVIYCVFELYNIAHVNITITFTQCLSCDPLAVR